MHTIGYYVNFFCFILTNVISFFQGCGLGLGPGPVCLGSRLGLGPKGLGVSSRVRTFSSRRDVSCRRAVHNFSSPIQTCMP